MFFSNTGLISYTTTGQTFRYIGKSSLLTHWSVWLSGHVLPLILAVCPVFLFHYQLMGESLSFFVCGWRYIGLHMPATGVRPWVRKYLQQLERANMCASCASVCAVASNHQARLAVDRTKDLGDGYLSGCGPELDTGQTEGSWCWLLKEPGGPRQLLGRPQCLGLGYQ